MAAFPWFPNPAGNRNECRREPSPLGPDHGAMRKPHLALWAGTSLIALSAAGTLQAAAGRAWESVALGNALGIAMEGVAYPFPVKFLPLQVRDEPVRLGYMDVAPTREPNGRAVLLLHGKNFYGSYWENTIRALSDAGYRVVVPDQIGFGKSSKPAATYSFESLAAQTAQLLDHLGVQTVAVVGHSMGGMLAVRFARSYPERTSQLILENPIGLEDYAQKVPRRSLQQLYENELNQTSDAFRSYVRAYYAEPRAELIEPFVSVRQRLTLSGEFPRWAMAAALTYQMIYEQPVRAEFHLIGCPTLLVIGQTDRTAVGKAAAPPDVRETLGNYPALGKAAAADIPKSRLVELDGVGHIPHLEAPERFHEALLSFLATGAESVGKFARDYRVATLQASATE